MMNGRKDVYEIDLYKLLAAYLSKWRLILLCTVATALVTLYISANIITPMYEAYVTVYVNNVRSGQDVDTITSTNLSTSQKLVNTYVTIIKSDTVLEKVAAASGMDATAEQIRKMMSAKQVESTELFTVTITHADPVKAEQLANAVAKVAPGEIERIVEGSSTKIIDYAKLPQEPSSPSLAKNTFLGALAGFVITVIYVTIVFLLDVRIKDEEDLMALFGLPVLAQIPSFIPEGTKRRNGYDNGNYGYGNDAGKGEEV